MKAEAILESDVLDIIFNNKNKDYGAYQLRKQYSYRLKKSVGITTILVLIFAGLQSWKTPKVICKIDVGMLADVSLIDYVAPTEKPIEKPLEKLANKQTLKEVIFTKPMIVSNTSETKNIPRNSDIDTSLIGNHFIQGAAPAGIVGESINNNKLPFGYGKLPENEQPIVNLPTDAAPIENPSINASFPGGLAALKNFMLHNLHQPDDIEEGQKIVILAKFVIDKDGNISDVKIIQNGRADLDEEVIRVINKMPQWKPGLQNGLAVPVYFKMPITFINNN